MPTFIDAAGGTYPKQHAGAAIPPMAGKSLLPAIVDNAPIQRESLCWEHHGNRAIRIGDWKLVARGEAGQWELYNMADDRTELNNLAAEQPRRVKEMNEKWWSWAKRCDVLPMNPNRKGEFLKRKLESRKRRKERDAGKRTE